jgi:hypothetical protein
LSSCITDEEEDDMYHIWSNSFHFPDKCDYYLEESNLFGNSWYTIVHLFTFTLSTSTSTHCMYTDAPQFRIFRVGTFNLWNFMNDWKWRLEHIARLVYLYFEVNSITNTSKGKTEESGHFCSARSQNRQVRKR